jgi:hypothetical protein
MMEHGTFDSDEFRTSEQSSRALKKFEGMQNKNSRTFHNLVLQTGI